MKSIPRGAAVRDLKSGKLGRTFSQPGGTARGHLWVQFDGDKDRKTVRISEVSYVARDYDTAKTWDAKNGG